MKSRPHPPKALLLVAPGCPHCATVLEGLSTLIKDAVIGQLEVINIAAEPEQARLLGVRSVPWTRLADFELEGLHTLGELRHWAELAGDENGMTEYFKDLLTTGRRTKVETLARQHPEWLEAFVRLLGDPETGIDARLGVMATLEELQGSGLAASLVEPLTRLLRSDIPRIRTDACHALALTESTHALPHLRACLSDSDPEVREAAEDGLELLEEG